MAAPTSRASTRQGTSSRSSIPSSACTSPPAPRFRVRGSSGHGKIKRKKATGLRFCRFALFAARLLPLTAPPALRPGRAQTYHRPTPLRAARRRPRTGAGRAKRQSHHGRPQCGAARGAAGSGAATTGSSAAASGRGPQGRGRRDRQGLDRQGRCRQQAGPDGQGLEARRRGQGLSPRHRPGRLSTGTRPTSPRATTR